jgi:hypothetical protein
MRAGLMPIDSQLARLAKYGPREHLRSYLLLRYTLPRLPLVGLRIYLTELNLDT